MTEIQCYNTSCGAKFDPASNTEDSCHYHSGGPIFHDALKGWSCCKKRTTDFSEFMKIPGCTTGKHSNEKPKAAMKAKVETTKQNKEVSILEKIITPPPKPINTVELDRPSSTEPLISIPIKVTSSYDKLKAMKTSAAVDDGVIKIGTKCRNGGCEEVYANAPCDLSECNHHPGIPVFHEGMKYWSCCQRKTSDFTAFLSQAGCSKGSHLWKSNTEEKTVCRKDWHQTGPNVIVSIFAKHANIETSKFEVNQVYLKANIDYEGHKHFDLQMHLFGVVDPKVCKVTVSGTKIEITLRKRDALYWKTLGEDDSKEEVQEQEQKKLKVTTKVEKKAESDSDSDLSGIDDVIFD
nr:cysteine and histidine-rich domain-containing protein 1-like [Ciona intestinalis]|eukprot:XP_018670078.1 cysteine and histidine-rich domain-containing protein 1-like [Ciona intestinalis]